MAADRRRRALARLGRLAPVVSGVLVLWLGWLASPAGAQVTVPTAPGGTTTTTEPPEETTTTSTPSTTPTTSATTTTPSATETTTPVAVTDPGTTTSTAATTATTAPRSSTRPRPARPISALSPAAVTGSFGVGIAAVLGFAGLLILSATHTRPGGASMSELRRNRLLLGLGCLAVAAVVGIVGYLKLSLEPDVNRQIPYLASAGMALVLLSALGGSLIVGEQLRADDKRIEELEDAVRTLAAAVAPSVEAPARVAHRVEPTEDQLPARGRRTASRP